MPSCGEGYPPANGGTAIRSLDVRVWSPDAEIPGSQYGEEMPPDVVRLEVARELDITIGAASRR